MDYSDIKSNFIKEKIKQTGWKDKKYIDDLITIEHYVLGYDTAKSILGCWTDGIMYILETGHPEEWKAIWEELRPKELEKMHEKEKSQENAIKVIKEQKEKQKREELEKEKKDWLNVGGKL